MLRIRPKDLVYATGVLRWLLFSIDPWAILMLTDLADAVAFDFSDGACYKYDPSLRDDNATAIPEWFEGLVTIVDKSHGQHVALAHASVRDYLLSQRFTEDFHHDLSPGFSHAFLARTCIGYLLHFADPPLPPRPHLGYNMAEYTAIHWCHHLLSSNDKDALTLEAMPLLEDGSQQYNTLNNLSKFLRFCPLIYINSCI
jgi:hypothetical protein